MNMILSPINIELNFFWNIISSTYIASIKGVSVLKLCATCFER